MKKMLIIGGGTAGITGALEATALGFEAYLVEKKDHLGGYAVDYCCKATDRCNKCSACLVPQTLRRLEKNSKVNIYLSSRVKSVSGASGHYTVTLDTPQGDVQLLVNAVVLATGFAPFDMRQRSEYGYGRNKNVITGLELEKIIREKGSLSAAIGEVKKIGFIQCIGSRDLQVENGYCSRVCCMYSSKLAKLIRSELPQAEIAIFYMDLQTFGRGFDEFMQSCEKDDKIQFIRGIPAKVFDFPYERLTVRYANSMTGEALEGQYDLLVLATAITPGEDGQSLAEMFQISLDEYGFFASDKMVPVYTSQPGVFLAGTCQSPRDIPQCIAQAKAAVSAAAGFVAGL